MQRVERVERYRVGRGALRDLRPVIAVFVATLFLALPAAAALVDWGAPPYLAAVAMLACIVGLLVYINLPGHVLVGSDGVHVDTRDAARFVHFSTLASVEPYLENVVSKRMVGVVLHLLDGGEVKIPIGEDQFGASDHAATVAARIGAALEAHRAAAPAEPELRLAPGDRSDEAWLEDLRRLGAGAAGPRIAPLPVERLWRIAEDPAAIAPSRAAAAVALRASLDAAGRERLRSVAASTADLPLRAAIEAAAEEDERATAEALAAVRARAERR
jgi:hypothetical protein